jgi:hypothetical protein
MDNWMVFSCYEVLEELKVKDDDLYAWALERKEAFCLPTPDTAAQMRIVMARHRNLAATGGSLNRADPWVIAQALVLGATVVTDEAPEPNRRQTKPPKMPDVCESMGLAWVPPIEFLSLVGCRL